MNTAQDVVFYLLSATGGGAQDGEHHAVRQAVINGVREVMQSRQWLWHVRSASFTTRRSSTSATITSGSKTISVANATDFVPGRMLEVAAAYFPTPVRIAAVSGTTVTLDVAATQSGSGVTVIPQIFYDLPPDLKDIDTLSTNTVGTLHCYISPQEWQRLEVNTRGSGEPYYYTVMRSDTKPDRYQVRFVGVPQPDTVVHYTYRVIPNPIKYMGYEKSCRQGTVSVAFVGANNIPTVTGKGTSFPQDCAGGYIRFGNVGVPAEPAGSLTPFLFERRIEQWNSATELEFSDTSVFKRTEPEGVTLLQTFDSGVVGQDAVGSGIYDGGVVGDQGAGNAPPYISPLAYPPAGSRYAITDIIDASPQMYTAILSACEMWYARVAGKPAGDAMALFARDMRLAMENDVVAPLSGRPYDTPYPTPRSMGWHSELLPDIA